MMSNGDITLERITKVGDGFYTNPDFVHDEMESCAGFEDHTANPKPEFDAKHEDAPKWRRFIKPVIVVVLLLAYNGYLAAGIVLTWHKAKDYCHDIKLITVITCVVYAYALLKILQHIYQRYLKEPLQGIADCVSYRWLQSHWYWVRIATWATCWIAVLAFLIYDCLEDVRRLISVGGALVLIFLGFVFSKHRKHALPVIFYFSFIVSILYYVGAMQWLVLRVGWLLQVTVGTTVCESMTAAANIFLGMTEAPLMIHPFLAVMTKSELHTVMTGGFATIAGSVMAAYISMGVSASHLLTASIMSAPAALAFSKLLYPEVEDSKTQSENIKLPKSEETNVLEAACNGTIIALTILGFIVANLIGFLAFLAFLNGTLLWLGNIVDVDSLTFEWLLGQVFRPLAYIMGVPWHDCGPVGELLGIKTFANEFIAYAQLGKIKSQLEERSVVIATYALCGFSNVGSVGIVLGSLGALCPERKADLSAIAVRALCAGSAACFITACIAGSLIP